MCVLADFHLVFLSKLIVNSLDAGLCYFLNEFSEALASLMSFLNLGFQPQQILTLNLVFGSRLWAFV